MNFLEKLKANKKNRLILLIFILIILIFIFIFSPVKKIVTQVTPDLPQKPARIFPSKTISLQTPYSENLEIKQPIFPENICNILDYGAISDGKTKNTQAFADAITDCDKKEGGMIFVPNGIWLTGPIHLKNNINLHLEDNAEILFSTNFSDYLPMVFSRFEGIEYYNYSPLIYGNDVTNIAITGNGTLNGQGSVWWKMLSFKTIDRLYTMGEDNIPIKERIFGTEKDGLRPSFINFINSKNIFIDGVHIINGPMWTIHPVYSTDITISNVNIKTFPGPSTDGVVIDSSKNVLVENSFFSTGDDSIVLKSGRDKDGQRIGRPTEDVVVRNNNIEESHAALSIGSEMSGGIRNIFFTDNNINRAQYAIRIKSQIGRGGIVENIWAKNTMARRIDFDVVKIETSYGIPFRLNSVDEPIIRNVTIENVVVSRAKHTAFISGLINTPISNVSLNNLEINSKKGIIIENSSDINFDHISILPLADPLFSISDSKDINIANTLCMNQSKTCLYVTGKLSENIKSSESSFSTYPNKIKFGKDANENSVILEQIHSSNNNIK